MKKILILIVIIFLSTFTFGCGDSHVHNWGDWKDNYDGITHSRTCKENYLHTEKKNHTLDNGVFIKEVTDLHNGIVLYTCTECGYEKEEIIPPTGNHNFIKEIADDEHLYKNVSSATKVYYKSCIDCGAYGNSEYLFEKTNLPSDYLELEYIVSDGYQHIDTKFKANNDSGIKLKCSYTDRYSLYGGTPGYFNFTATNSSAVGYFYYSGYSSGRSPMGDFANKVHIFEQDKNVCYVDGEEYHSFEYTEWQDKNNLYLFARNNDGVIDDAGGNIKLYYCQIYDNEELIRDYVPVVNISTNTYGLFDLVSNEFYANSNNFAVGNATIENVLPDGYTQVEYIESNGNQVIDTEIETYNKWQFDIEFVVDGKRQLMGYGGNGDEYWGIQEDGSYGVLNTSNIFAGNRDNVVFDYEGDNKYLSINGNLINNLGYTTISRSYKLFALNDSLAFSCKAKLYSCKSWNQNVLVRDYIPCIEESTKAIGLYDLVTNKFFKSKTYAPFTGGDIAGHDFGEGITLAERTYCQDGETLVYCKICGKQLHKYEEKYSYKVEFTFDGGVEYVKIFSDYDPNNYEVSNSAYTRNKNTFNYSQVDGVVICEIVLKENYKIYTSHCSDVNIIVSKKDNRYVISNITKDVKISIITQSE